MKALKTSFAVTALSLLLTATAQASPINVGGVVWDPSAPLDFRSFSANLVQEPGVTPLSGYGRIDQINGTSQNVFCPGCEVTFTFTAYVPNTELLPGTSLFPNAAGRLEFTGGLVTVYVDSSPDFDLFDASSAGADADTQVFLRLSGASLFGTTPTVFGPSTTLVADASGAGGTAVGLLDVIDGLADGNFDTNTLPNGADFEFQNSITTGTVGNLRFGSGNFRGDSIPEPGTLALFGLGFAGMGALSRRRRAQQG